MIHCRENVEDSDSVLKLLFRECKKRKLSYSSVALQSLTKSLRALKVDQFSEVWKLVLPFFLKKEKSADSSSDDDDAIEKEADFTIDNFKPIALNCSSNAWLAAEAATQLQHHLDLLRHLVDVCGASDYSTHLAALQFICEVVSSLGKLADEQTSSSAVHDLLISTVCSSLSNLNFTQIRVQGLLIAEGLSKLKQQGDAAKESNKLLVESLRTSKLISEPNEYTDKANDLLKKLNDL